MRSHADPDRRLGRDPADALGAPYISRPLRLRAFPSGVTAGDAGVRTGAAIIEGGDRDFATARLSIDASVASSAVRWHRTVDLSSDVRAAFLSLHHRPMIAIRLPRASRHS